jgi:hypothetical protein
MIITTIPFWLLILVSCWAHCNLHRLEKEDKIILKIVNPFLDIGIQVLAISFYAWMRLGYLKQFEIKPAIAQLVFSVLLNASLVHLFNSTWEVTDMQI